MLFQMAYKDYPFYHGAKAYTFEQARALKANSTEAEELLWQKLKAKRFHGLKFRRQHPINKFVVDFYCNELKLVIEVDGGIHLKEDIRERDIERENIISEFGLTIVRYTNEEIMDNIICVLIKLETYIKKQPSLSILEREKKGEV